MRMNSLPAIPEEIRQLIGTYLDKQTLGTVIQVCRSLHSSFVPLLWKQAELRSACGPWGYYVDSGAETTHTNNEGFAEKYKGHLPSPPPSPGFYSSSSSSSLMMDLTLLQARSRHIEHLTISAPIPSDYYTVAFPRLRTLIFTDDYSTTGSSPLDIVQLAHLNPTIERLIINNIQSSLPAQFWETVFLEWKNPKALSIRYSPISKDGAAVAALWKASTRFEDLELQGVDLPHYVHTLTADITADSSDDDELSSSSSAPLLITAFPKAKRVHLNHTRRPIPEIIPDPWWGMGTLYDERVKSSREALRDIGESFGAGV
ncbi:hypothetical protein BGZ47_003549 [Haplosporangium gracile]|nr:hypothetical protein BGZ47_003549 [Haplosporangium gracile]